MPPWVSLSIKRLRICIGDLCPQFVQFRTILYLTSDVALVLLSLPLSRIIYKNMPKSDAAYTSRFVGPMRMVCEEQT